MLISIQENLLPGETLNEKLDCAETLQIDGVEIQGRSRLYDRISEYEAAFNNRTVRISSICGQSTFDWLDPDLAKRQASIDESRRNLEACGHFGARRADCAADLRPPAAAGPFPAQGCGGAGKRAVGRDHSRTGRLRAQSRHAAVVRASQPL